MSATRRLFSPKTLKGLWVLNSRALDESGYGNNATWSGSEGYSAGPFGKMVGSFDGSTDYLSMASTNFPSGSGSRTVSCWINCNSIASARYVFGYGDTTANEEFSIFIDTDGMVYLSKFAGNSGAFTGVLSINVWYHLAVVYDGSTLFGYLNGDLSGSNAVGTLATGLDGTPVIGARLGTAGKFSGSLGNVRIYNVALTGDEIKALYLSRK